MDSTAPQSRKIVVDGKVESLIVYFRDGAHIADQLPITLDGMGRVLIYVGKDDMPVALQFVDPLPDVAPAGRPSPTPEEDAETRRMLYGLACQLIVSARNQRAITPAVAESAARLEVSAA